jgi:hypothetical protein
MTYQEYIQSDEWKSKAEAAKKRAGYRCQVCNSPDYLEAHHRTYERMCDELPGDITVLCKECHELFSQFGRLGSLDKSYLDWLKVKPWLMSFADWINKYQGMI